MKKSYILFVLFQLSITCSVFSQESMRLDKTEYASSNGTVIRLQDRDLIQLLDSVYWFAWNSNFDYWLPSYRYRDYVYSDDEKLLSRNGQNNQSLNTWANEFRNEYSYDNSGLLVQNEGFYGIGSGWSPAEMTVFSYDAFGFLLVEEVLMWNNNAWHPSNKYVHARDQNHRDSIVTYFQFFDPIYQAQTEHRYSYTTENQIKTDSLYSISENVYTMTQNYWYDYTSDNLLSTQILQNFITGSWTNVQKEDYLYDGDLRMVSDAKYSWQNEVWDADTKWEGSFVSATHFEGHYYSWMNNAWNETSELIRDYNESGQLISETDSRISASNFYHRDAILNEYDANGFLVANSNLTYTGLGEYNLLHGDSTHYYFGTLTNILQLKNDEELTVFPNPSSTGRFFVKSNAKPCQEIMAFDTQGRLIKRTYSTNFIDLSDAENGTYILFVSTGESMVCRQVVLRK